jgi:hypothetical protein
MAAPAMLGLAVLRAGHPLTAQDHSQGRSLRSRRHGDGRKRPPLSSDLARQDHRHLSEGRRKARRALIWPGHIRARYRDDQRARTVNQGSSDAHDQHICSSTSGRADHNRSSKLVMRVRFLSPVPGLRRRSGLFFSVRLRFAGPLAGSACPCVSQGRARPGLT